MNDFPIQLKDADSPAPPDAQSVGIELMELLREIEEEAVQLQALFVRWGNDPVAVMRKAQSRTSDLRALALRAPELGEQLMQSLRATGVLSPSRASR